MNAKSGPLNPDPDPQRVHQLTRFVQLRAPPGVPAMTAGVVRVQVVGAGRGPLVTASLAAAARAGRKLRVYAVEKNPNAVVTLHNLVATQGCGTCARCRA